MSHESFNCLLGSEMPYQTKVLDFKSQHRHFEIKNMWKKKLLAMTQTTSGILTH